jgi:adenylate cyclase
LPVAVDAEPEEISMIRSLLNMSRKPIFLIALVISACGVGAYTFGLYFIDIIELKTVDLRFNLRGTVTPGPEVVLAVIDEKSLDNEGKWVWPRWKLARLVDKLSLAGAKVIAFDIGFHEPDDQRVLQAIKTIRADLGDTGETDSLALYFNQLQAGADNDHLLARAMETSRARVVLGWFFHMQADADSVRHLGQDQIKAYEERLRSARYLYTHSDFNVEPDLAYISRIAAPEPNIDRLSKATPWAGFFNFEPDIDGVVRWMPSVLQFNGNLYAPLSLMALSAYWEEPLHLEIGEHGEVIATCIGDRICAPTDEHGRIMINYRGKANTFKYLSVTDILNDRVPGPLLKDKIVLVGATATGTYDLTVTPVSAKFPGPEIHVNVIDSILAGDFVEQPGYFNLMNVTAIIVCGLLLGAALSRFGMVGGAVATLVFMVGYIYLCLTLFSKLGLVINMVYPLLVMTAIYVGTTAFKYFIEEGKKRFIQNTFSRYLAPTVVQQLIESPEKIELGGEQRDITAFFSDVQGFTGISEKLSPTELVELLNQFLTEMTDIILKNNGTVDKFEGDAIIAFFGAPNILENHGQTATLACIDMQLRMAALRKQWRQSGKPELHMRIGLCSGPAVVGNMGSKNRMDYTMMGDTVNTAARLEGANKVYGTYTMVGEATKRMLDSSILLREIDSIAVVGRQEPIQVYEPIGRREDLDSRTIRIIDGYAKGLAAYRERLWQEAQGHFRQLLVEAPDDGPGKTMLARCRQFEMDPPAPDWQGAFSLSSK